MGFAFAQPILRIERISVAPAIARDTVGLSCSRRRRRAPEKSIEIKEEDVIKVSVLYPNTQGCKFDMNYYLTRHMPMVQQKLGAACKRMAVEEGIAGGAPGAPATYVAMGH